MQISANELEEKIKNYILNNPQIIIESLNNFEKQKQNEKKVDNKKKINVFKSEIFNSESLYEGNKSSQKIIVEFFDYNCSYCKRAHADLKKIISENKDIKVIYKNFPILSDRSVELAKYALIISELGNAKFIRFHNYLLKQKGKINDNDLDLILKELNIDKAFLNKKLKDDSINSKLQNDYDLANNLGLNGTPAFVIGDEIIFGYISKKELLSRLNQQ